MANVVHKTAAARNCAARDPSAVNRGRVGLGPVTHAAHGQRRRGRQPRISRDRIVEAAYEIGIENLTMAAVAERLGVTHQSLYGWVQDRDEVVDLVSDLLVRRLEISAPPDPGGWRDSLRAYANGLRGLAGEMPGFAAASLGRFRRTEGFVKVNNDVLHVLTGVGFEPALAQRIYDTLNTSLLGWIAREEAMQPLLDEHKAELAPKTAAGGANEHGHIATALAVAELKAERDERFEFLVHTFLAGLPDPPTRTGGNATPDVPILDLRQPQELASVRQSSE